MTGGVFNISIILPVLPVFSIVFIMIFQSPFSWRFMFNGILITMVDILYVLVLVHT